MSSRPTVFLTSNGDYKLLLGHRIEQEEEEGLGAAKNKRQRFIAANPFCCFCGGTEPATTIDHVPPRTCFPDRLAPEGFEFPACEWCQSASRLDELALGFFVRLVDPDDSAYRQDQSANALKGLRNNLPGLMPKFNLTNSEKRQGFRDYDIARPVGVLMSDVPMVGVPDEAHEAILRYARKLAAALFYREIGKPGPLDYFVWATWSQGANVAHMKAWRGFVEMTPLINRAGRTNLDFGNRFGYRCNKKANPDLFAAIAQFGEGLALAMVVVNPASRSRLDHTDWVAIGDNYPQPGLCR